MKNICISLILTFLAVANTVAQELIEYPESKTQTGELIYLGSDSIEYSKYLDHIQDWCKELEGS